MSYYFSKTVEGSFDDAIAKVTGKLKKEGFGILTEIDVKATLKGKLDVEFGKYRILGACHPSFAHKALKVENKIGIMLPCNVVVREVSKGEIEVAAVDPIASMKAVENEELEQIAGDVAQKLQRVIDNL